MSPGVIGGSRAYSSPRRASGMGWSVGVAIGELAGGPIETRGELRESRAWSTMKVPVVVASILCRPGGLGRGRGRRSRVPTTTPRCASGTVSTTGRRGRGDPAASRRRDTDARARAGPARIELVRSHRVVARGRRDFYARSPTVSSCRGGHRARARRHGTDRPGAALGARPDPGNPLQGRLGAERGARAAATR